MTTRLADRLLSGEEAYTLLGISESSFWRLVHAGRIARVDLSGTGKSGRGRKLWKFRESALWAYVDANEGVSAPRPEGAAPAPKPVGGRDALLAAGWDGTDHDTRKPKG